VASVAWMEDDLIIGFQNRATRRNQGIAR